MAHEKQHQTIYRTTVRGKLSWRTLTHTAGKMSKGAGIMSRRPWAPTAGRFYPPPHTWYSSTQWAVGVCYLVAGGEGEGGPHTAPHTPAAHTHTVGREMAEENRDSSRGGGEEGNGQDAEI